MRTTLQHLSLGLFIGSLTTGLFVIALLFSSPGLLNPPTPSATSTPPPPTKTATASSTPTTPPTATFTPTPTLLNALSGTLSGSASPSPTPDAVQSMINTGGLIFVGALSNPEQVALYRSSLGYIRTSTEDSRALSKEINGVGYGDPTNICGPLAIAILRDAGLMNPDIVPHDFWLLNPLATTDHALLARAFPADRYAYSKTLVPLNKINWRETPLLPGDFLFIWHGSGGNFDHMVVVNRIDASLRAYAVTNYGTPAGYIIGEALLYDPSDPDMGLFRQWTKERDAILGSTGFGGFELWRPRAP